MLVMIGTDCIGAWLVVNPTITRSRPRRPRENKKKQYIIFLFNIKYNRQSINVIFL